jgi:4-hydroxy-4-methyl-2-oxoglutarate aldolase
MIVAEGLSAASLYESGARRMLPISIRPLDPGWRVLGRVFTVDLAPGHNIWIHRAVYAAQPGDVLVVATSGGIEFGYWGDVLTAAAREVGLGGLIIDGCVRDSQVLGKIGWPVFARGLCVRGTGKDADLGGGMGEPITMGDCTVNTGDLVFGDCDGIVVMAAHEASDIAAKALARDVAEDAIVARLASGETTMSVYGLP